MLNFTFERHDQSNLIRMQSNIACQVFLFYMVVGFLANLISSYFSKKMHKLLAHIYMNGTVNNRVPNHRANRQSIGKSPIGPFRITTLYLAL